MIYFDCASTSLQKPPEVVEAVSDAIKAFGNPGRGTHKAALTASRCIFQTRKAVSKFFNSSVERTIFTSGATESLNIAIFGLLKPSDHVITTVLEHNSVLRPLYLLKQKGMQLSFVGIHNNGHTSQLEYDAFERNLQSNTRAVVLTHASNLTGYVVDIEFVADFCKKHGLLLIVDAAQSAGLFDLNVDALCIDAFCFTGHKGLYGLQGTGGLCLKSDLELSPMKVGGTGTNSFSETHPNILPEMLEAGTLNSHGIAGLLAGIEYINQKGIENIRNRARNLAKQFYESVVTITNVKVYSSIRCEHVPIVTINIGNLDSGEAEYRLANSFDICVRSGTHCAPLLHKALKTVHQGVLRFSFSHFNTEDEVEKGVRAVYEIAKGCG